jgi:hypothetical protein
MGPPGVPDREWKRIAKAIGHLPYPGARWRIVQRGLYERWLSEQDDAAATVPPANDASDEEWSPGAAFASVGLRPTR